MAFVDSLFNPAAYAGGMSGILQQALQSGLLRLPQNSQSPAVTPTGPTYANGTQGAMGGVPFPIAPAGDSIPANARPAGPAQIPQQQTQGAPIPALQENPLWKVFDALGLNGPIGVGNKLAYQQAMMQAQYGALAPKLGSAGAIAAITNPGVLPAIAKPTTVPFMGAYVPSPLIGGAQPSGQPQQSAGQPTAQNGTQPFTNSAGMPSGDQLDVMADRYRLTGEVPRMYGQAGSMAMIQVQQRAAQRAQDNIPILPAARQLAANQGEFKSFQQSQSTLGTRLGNVTQAIEEMGPLLDQVNKAYAAVPNMSSIVPWNKLVQAGQVTFGDPNVARLRASVLTAANAYARMVSSSGQPHQQSVEHALSVLEQGYSNNQMAAAGLQLAREADAIRLGNERARQSLSKSYLGKSTARTAAPPDVLSSAKAAIAQGAPRDAVILRLQENGYTADGL